MPVGMLVLVPNPPSMFATYRPEPSSRTPIDGIVQKATDGDVESSCLRIMMAREAGSPDQRRARLRQCIESDAEGFFVAEIDGKVAGFGRVQLLTPPLAFVSEDPALAHRGHVALEDVQVCAADRGGADVDDGVSLLRQGGVGDLVPALLALDVIASAFAVSSWRFQHVTTLSPIDQLQMVHHREAAACLWLSARSGMVADRALSGGDCLQRATGAALLTIAKCDRRTCWDAQRMSETRWSACR